MIKMEALTLPLLIGGSDGKELWKATIPSKSAPPLTIRIDTAPPKQNPMAPILVESTVS